MKNEGQFPLGLSAVRRRSVSGYPDRVTPVVRKAPHFSREDAVRFADQLYGVRTVAEGLPSERDQNFQLRNAAGCQYVLKIANQEEALEVLDLQNKVMRFLDATIRDWPGRV